MTQPSIYVPLMGGLGNQLFQLAAALSIGQNADIILNSHIYAPRSQPDGTPDIAGFRLPDHVRSHQNPGAVAPSRVTSRAARLMIEKASASESGPVMDVMRSLARSASSVLLWRHLRTLAVLKPSSVSGYDPSLAAPARDTILTGFFQTWRYWSEPGVNAALRAMEPLKASGWLGEMRQLAATEAPTVVHVRLADYRTHADFGIPTVQYYRSALAALRSSEGTGRPWIFSDEPDAASAFLPPELLSLNPRFVVPPKDADPACTLAAMSLGRQFILANSSFGYWAAALSSADAAQVTIPEPWFIGLPAFVDFAPEGWRRIDR